ncbi:LysR substrate-binding domain-containing protein [Acinetobacter vivianii]|uniref:LysR substrate-binding domain-containing protein n=1 Tax=Acinetobacter vivianii TaxID=1776742 RepID=UPI0040426D85
MSETNNQISSHVRIDLNLFRVFSTIYREKNLTRASEQLFLSQPAVSHALARLRNQFNDPLFIRDGHGVFPSPLAKRLWPKIEQALQLMDLAIQSTYNFQPAQDLKQLTIAISDEYEWIFLPSIIQQLTKFNPDLQLNSVRIDRKNLRHELSTGKIDFAIDVEHMVEESISYECLSQDKFIVIANKQHPLLSLKELTKEIYLDAKHITVSSRPTGRVFEDFFLSKKGIKRKISFRCQQYETAIRLVTQTDHLLTIPQCQIAYFKDNYPQIKVHPLPVDIAGYQMNLYWDEQKSHEHQIMWCKMQLLQIMEQFVE